MSWRTSSLPSSTTHSDYMTVTTLSLSCHSIVTTWVTDIITALSQHSDYMSHHIVTALSHCIVVLHEEIGGFTCNPSAYCLCHCMHILYCFSWSKRSTVTASSCRPPPRVCLITVKYHGSLTRSTECPACKKQCTMPLWGRSIVMQPQLHCVADVHWPLRLPGNTS